MKLNLSNPLLIFAAIWLFSFALFMLNMTSNIVPMNTSILILVLGNVLSAVLIYLYIGAHTEVKSQAGFIELYHLNERRFDRFIRYLLAFWVFGSVLDIVYSRGLPILWAVLGADRDYTDFGIPSFHGVVNASYLFALTMMGFKYVVDRQKRVLFFIALLLLWPVAMLGRGILLSALIQIAAVFFFLNRMHLRSAVSVVLGILAVIYVFGWLGDLRGTANPFVYLVRQDYRDVFASLPSGFLWFYIYVTTGLNNVAANIESLQPGYTLHYSVINLLPSFLRTSLDNYQLNASLLKLVDQNLNTSTFYSGYISDFGLIGGLLGGVVLQLSATITYFKARAGSVPALLAYSILFQCLVLSPFYDLLFLLPYLAQISFALLLSLLLSTPARAAERPSRPEQAA